MPVVEGAQTLELVSPEQAIATVGSSDLPYASRAVLADATIGSTLECKGDQRIENRRVWVVVYSFAKLVEIPRMQKASTLDASPLPPLLASQMVNLVDARTGQLLWGFFIYV
jgi:hypothetical protein